MPTELPHVWCWLQEGVKFTRKNPNLRPFEAGGETSLEHFASKADCGLFALASHSKKRPHGLTLGRFYDVHLYDLCEFGVERYRGLQDFAACASTVQVGNKVLPGCLPQGQSFTSSCGQFSALFQQALLDVSAHSTILCCAALPPLCGPGF